MLRKVVPTSCLALLVIWLLVSLGGIWALTQRNAESLKAAADQQVWTVAEKINLFFDNLRSVADNALVINAFIDPLSVEHFLQPFFRSFRIGQYTSLSISMTDFSGLIIASNGDGPEAAAPPPRDLWLTPAIDGEEVLTIHEGSLIAAVPVRIGSLPEGAILVTLSPEDTRMLLASRQHGGAVTLRDRRRDIAFQTTAEEPLLAASQVEAKTITLADFPGISLRSEVAATEDTPLLGLLHVFLLVAFCADLAALVFGIYMAARLVAEPLNLLVSRIQSMQQLTDPSERLAVDGPTELRNLARAFNMAADRQAELTLTLEQSLASEKEINHIQRQFVSLVSHEFRTPLAIIDGQAQRILRRIEREPRERIRASMEKCRSSVARLIGLIESVLSSSRLEAGTIEFKPAPCQLVELLEDAARNQQGISPHHKIVLDIEPLPGTIVADEKLMRQVFTNLLSNAVKYSPDAPNIKVEGRRDGDDVVIAFRDQGVGIPEKEISKLFSRFFRASTASGIAGTGIGLNLVKQLVEMHEGEITVTSAANAGSTFTIRLPIAGSPEAQAEAA